MKAVNSFLIGAIALGVAQTVQAEQISVAELGALPEADVYFLGEVHDNPAHHLSQAAAVRALKPNALVFEMFTDAQALNIRPETRTDAARLAQVLEWEPSGWPDFAMYFPIFVAAGEGAIYGGGTRRDIVRKVVADGAAAAFGGGADVFGVDEPLDDDEQFERESLQLAAHCNALPSEMLGGMVEAQRYRDAVLARAVIAATLESGGPVAVITGNGHARKDWGAPRMLEHADPELRVVSIGQFESEPGEFEAQFDFWLLSDPVERDDPCAVFTDK